VIDVQNEDFADYVHHLDIAQNERMQEDEHEVVRLWNAKATLISELDILAQFKSSAIDDHVSVADTDSQCDDNDSVISHQTDYPKVSGSH
jgi:hypothetical protein